MVCWAEIISSFARPIRPRQINSLPQQLWLYFSDFGTIFRSLFWSRLTQSWYGSANGSGCNSNNADIFNTKARESFCSLSIHIHGVSELHLLIHAWMPDFVFNLRWYRPIFSSLLLQSPQCADSSAALIATIHYAVDRMWEDWFGDTATANHLASMVIIFNGKPHLVVDRGVILALTVIPFVLTE